MARKIGSASAIEAAAITASGSMRSGRVPSRRISARPQAAVHSNASAIITSRRLAPRDRDSAYLPSFAHGAAGRAGMGEAGAADDRIGI